MTGVLTVNKPTIEKEQNCSFWQNQSVDAEVKHDEQYDGASPMAQQLIDSMEQTLRSSSLTKHGFPHACAGRRAHRGTEP